MIITRDIINKKIKFHDLNIEPEVGLKTFSYDEISHLIDGYKTFLLEKGAQPGDRVVIGEKSTSLQVAAVFACSELGLDIAIVNYLFKLGQQFAHNEDSYSQEIKQLMPLKFLLAHDLELQRIKYLSAICEHLILPPSLDVNYASNNTIYATPDTVFLSCVTLGDQGKRIVHSHEFIARLIKRNAGMLYGKVAATANLNHGSSPAAYFLPSLVSDKVTDYVTLLLNALSPKILEKIPNPEALFKYLKEWGFRLDHILMPYPNYTYNFLDSNPDEPQLNVHVLSSIMPNWIDYIQNKKIKDIISIFGTSECSGPILVNNGSDPCFNSDTYRKIDEFYDINLDDNKLTVGLPVYNKIITTGDSFKLTEDGRYELINKKHIPRINDHIIDINYYEFLFNKNYGLDIKLVPDYLLNKIYLIVWDNPIDESVIKEFDGVLREHSNGQHFISKQASLTRQEFFTSSSNRLIEYFRNNNEHN